MTGPPPGTVAAACDARGPAGPPGFDDHGDLDFGLALLARWTESTRRARGTPGVALAAVRGGQVVYAGGFGTAAAEQGTPTTPHTRFRFASPTKLLTAVAVLR